MYICKISIPVFFLTFAIIRIAGGSPETINGAYYLVDHGQIIREISEGWSHFFTCCKYAMLTSLPLCFISLMLLSLRMRRPDQAISKK